MPRLLLALLILLPAVAQAQIRPVRPAPMPRAGAAPPELREVVTPFMWPKLVLIASDPVKYAMVFAPGRGGGIYVTKEIVRDKEDPQRLVVRVREIRTRRFKLPLRVRLGELDSRRSHLIEVHDERRGLVGAYVLRPHKQALALSPAPYSVARMLLAEDLSTWVLRVEGLRTPDDGYVVTARSATRVGDRYVIEITAAPHPKRASMRIDKQVKEHAVHSALGKPDSGVHLIEVRYTIAGTTRRGCMLFGVQR